MSIGNIRNTNDLENKKRQYAEMLQLMIENEGVKEKRIADYKNPNKPPPVPPQYKSVAEQQKDSQQQERIAIDNIKDLGVDFAEARSFVLQLEQKKDGIDNLVKLNTNFPAFKKSVLDRLNPKQLNSNSLLNAWDEFSANIDIITGLKSVSTKSTSAFSPATDAVGKLPKEDSMANFSTFLDEIIAANNANRLDILQQLLNSTKDNLISSISYLISDAEEANISNLTPIERNQINTVAERLLSVNKIPTAKEINILMTQIESSFNALDERNLASTSDSISSGLVKLNRLLGQILDNDNKKRLTEFGDLVKKLIGNLYQETQQAKPQAEEVVYDSSSKPEMVRFIMSKRLYYKLLRIDLSEEFSDEELLEIADEISIMPKNKLQKFLRDYKKGLQDEEFLQRGGVKKSTSPEDALDDYEQKQADIQARIQRMGELFDRMGYQLRDYQILYRDIERLGLFKEFYDDKGNLIDYTSSVGNNYNNKNNLRDYIFSFVEDSPKLDLYLQRKFAEEEERFKVKKRVEAELLGKIVEGEHSKGRKGIKAELLAKFEEEEKKLIEEKKKIKAQPQLTYDYITTQINSLDIIDFYNRFVALSGKYPTYKRIVSYPSDSRKKGQIKPFDIWLEDKFADIPESAGASKDIILREDLRNVLKFIEFNSVNEAQIAKKIRSMISEGYNPMNNPDTREFGGFGVKKGKKKGGDLIHIDIGSHIGKNYREKADDSDSDSACSDYKPKKGKGAVQVYIPEDNLNRPKPKVGCGSKPYVHRRIKIGKGVEVAEQQPKYIEFGKFIIHRPQLEKNTLNFKYPSEGRVPTLPIVNIGDDFKDFIIGVLETGKLSDNQFNKLSQNEKDFFIKAVKGAGLENSLFKGKGKLYPDEEKKDRDRFNILKGEFDAGNNNQNLIKELRQLVIKFVDKRIIPKKQGLEFLQQLE